MDHRGPRKPSILLPFRCLAESMTEAHSDCSVGQASVPSGGKHFHDRLPIALCSTIVAMWDGKEPSPSCLVCSSSLLRNCLAHGTAE